MRDGELDPGSPGDGAASYADGKAPGAFRTIGEVCRALALRAHVLRYWEDQFPMLRPVKRSGGRRYYRPEDVRLIETIDRLVNRDGYTLRGARQYLETRTHVVPPTRATTPAPAPQVFAQPAPDAIAARLRAIRGTLARALDLPA